MPRQIKAGEATAARRRLYWQLVGTDGVTPATGEAGGQPQVSVDGAAWAGSGSVGVLVAVGNGRYYAELDPSAVASAGSWIESRFKSAATSECPGDSALVVSSDPATVEGQILALLTAAGTDVTVSSPVPADGGEVRIVQGDDYLAADGRALTWRVLTALNLATAAITLRLYDGTLESDGLVLSVACSASAAAGGYDVTAGLAAAQTGALAVRYDRGRYARRRYEVAAVLASGHALTLTSGVILVTE